MFSTMDANEEAHLSFCIQGYQVYNVIWSATVEEEFQYVREVGNAKERYPISDLQVSDAAGQVPQ